MLDELHAVELESTPSSALDDVLTRAEAADVARLHVSTIDRAIRRGSLPACQPNGRGGAVRIVRRDLLRWLGALAVGGALAFGGVHGCAGEHNHHKRGVRPRAAQVAPRAALRADRAVVPRVRPLEPASSSSGRA